MRILVTGGNSRFAKSLRKINTRYKFFFRDKKQLNILDLNSINKSLKAVKPSIVLHLGGLSRPISIHDKALDKSIDLNIIGTCNIVKACSKKNIKIIYLSTFHVYPGIRGNYKETDGVLPWNKYAWSKLGAESALNLYDNTLIIRVCMTEKPFVHKKAFNNVKSNYMFHEDAAKKIVKLFRYKGLVNVGGKIQTIYQFVKKTNPKIKKKNAKSIPLNQTMNLNKMKKLIG